MSLFAPRRAPSSNSIELPTVTVRPDGIVQTEFSGLVTQAHLDHMLKPFLDICRKAAEEGRAKCLWFVDAVEVTGYKIEITNSASNLVRCFQELGGVGICLLTHNGSVRLFASTLNIKFGLFKNEMFIRPFGNRVEAELYLRLQLEKLSR